MVSSNPSNHNVSFENLLKLCKTLKQLHQVHAQSITSGLLFLDQIQKDTAFTKILFTVTTIAPSATSAPCLPSPSSNRVLSYVESVFNLISNPSTFCFNTIIRAHALHFSPLSALSFFVQMRRCSVPPDFHTFPFVFKAFAQIRTIPLAQTLHCQASKFGFVSDLFVLNSMIRVYAVMNRIDEAYQVFDESSQRDVFTYNVLIDGFVKTGEISRARELFDLMTFRDRVSWNTLISGYAKMNLYREAIQLFNEMIALDLKPDNVAIVSALSACANLGGLEQGKAIHDYIKCNRIHVDSFLSTGLVDLYAKCGLIDAAMEIFESSTEKSLFTWNAMLVGLAMHGCGKLTIDYLSKMTNSGVNPDGISFLGVLVGCSHAGLVHEAKKLFDKMESVYGVEREPKHYGCMADLLGRSGLIEEAIEMINKMPKAKNDVFVWSGLLGGCRIHGNIEVAERAAEHVKALKPEDCGVYKVMADVYANAERWEDVVRVRRSMEEDKRLKKNAGCSLIVFDGFAHEFVAGDDLHPQTGEIYSALESIREHQFEAC